MSNLNVVSDIYSLFGQGNIPAIFNHLHENVEWEHDSEDYGIPWIKPGRGHAHVTRFFQALANIDFEQFDVLNLLEGPSQVVAVIRLGARVKSSGHEIRDLELHLWTFDDQGKVTRFRHVVDTHKHLAAAQA